MRLKGKTEMDAIIAYMRKLGTDIPWRKTAQAAVVGDLKNPFQDNKTVLPEGKAIYDKECAQCHGAALKGEIGPALADLDKPDADVFKIVYSGSPSAGMPGFGDTLGKEKVWKVVSYLKNAPEEMIWIRQAFTISALRSSCSWYFAAIVERTCSRKRTGEC